jgi:hypothetical protein
VVARGQVSALGQESLLGGGRVAGLRMVALLWRGWVALLWGGWVADQLTAQVGGSCVVTGTYRPEGSVSPQFFLNKF